MIAARNPAKETPLDEGASEGLAPGPVDGEGFAKGGRGDGRIQLGQAAGDGFEALGREEASGRDLDEGADVEADGEDRFDGLRRGVELGGELGRTWRLAGGVGGFGNGVHHSNQEAMLLRVEAHGLG